MFKKLCDKIGFKNGGTKELATILGALFLIAIIFGVLLHSVRANAEDKKNVHHYNDGTWEIVKILGKHKKD